MSRRRCCCECKTDSDDFNRSDSTDIGDAWEECVGDWSISGNHLTCDTTTDAVAVWLTPVVGRPYGILTATIHIWEPPDMQSPGFSSVGAKYRILAYYGAELTPCEGAADDPWILELEILTTTTGHLSLIDPDGVAIGPVDVSFTTQWTSLELCLGEDLIVGKCETKVLTSCGQAYGYWFALGSGGPTPPFFESVEYSDQYDHNITCPDCARNCCCPCLEGQRPTLTATIYAPECAHMHGASTTLTCNGIVGECCVWTSDADIEFTCPDEGEGCENYVYKLSLIMECGTSQGEPCEGYTMQVNWPGGSDNEHFCDFADDGVTKGAEPGCTCEPAILEFHGYRLWKDEAAMLDCCLCCESFDIVVTE